MYLISNEAIFALLNDKIIGFTMTSKDNKAGY